MIVSAFIIGAAATYLFYNSNGKNPVKTIKQETTPKSNEIYDKLLPLLKTDEKHAITALLENNGEMQQNKLAAKLNISKVKATRILYGLGQKNLITKERHGLTNIVRLKR